MELAISRQENEEARKELLDALTSGLEDWMENPLLAIPGRAFTVTNGFMQLLETIRTYESDTFSAEGSGISGEEVVLVANKLIDGLIENLDGVQIDAALSEIRPEEE